MGKFQGMDKIINLMLSCCLLHILSRNISNELVVPFNTCTNFLYEFEREENVFHPFCAKGSGFQRCYVGKHHSSILQLFKQ